MSFVDISKQAAESTPTEAQSGRPGARASGSKSSGSAVYAPGSRLAELDPEFRERLVSVLTRNGFGFIAADRRRSMLSSMAPTADFPFHFASAPTEVRPRAGMHAGTKRGLDLVLAVTAALALLPVMLVVALAITLEDRGPIVYHQFRTGHGRRPFRFFKFRSMVRNADSIKAALAAENEADGPIFKMRHDPRITRVGRLIRKSSIDELPQLWNVLRGDMSVVGPRPLYTPEAEKLAPCYARRHTVQPGLLCLREVCGRSELTFDEWMELDLIYIEARSLRTDLTIILRAIPAILSSRGAY